MAEHRPIDSTAPIEGERVGGFLRCWREQREWTLEQVSRALRIRIVHLQAIEDGRYAALPAKPYVVGFVRAYADLLGVDTEAVLRRLKVEMAHLPDQQELVFPEPAAERSIPGGALVSLSVCALIGIYAAWYYQSAQHHVRRDVEASAPALLAEAPAAPEARAPETLAVAPAPRPTPEPAPTPAALPAGVGAPAAAWQAMTIGREPAAPAPMTPMTPMPVGAAPPLAAAAPQPAPALAPPPMPAAAPELQAPAPSAGRGPAPALPSAAMLAGRPDLPQPVMRGAAPVQAAEVPGSGLNWTAAAAGPIMLRAVEPSWIEVRSAGGEVIHGRLLKAGDSYAVPPRADLRLTTGNAGGLEILVGSETAPKLGPRGAVIRDIALDGARLLAGTATARN